MYRQKRTVIFSSIFFRKEKKEIFKFQKKTPLKHFSIGICGCGHGCGVTHLTIALANYCVSKLRCSAACLELNQTSAFSKLSKFTSGTASFSKIKSHSVISIYGVDYYPELCCDDLPVIYNAGYCYLLLDFGVLTEETYRELLRCDQKIVIGSLAPWKTDIYHNFFQKYITEQRLRESFYYLVFFGEKNDMHCFSGKYHIFMQQLPFFRNPFHIEKEQFPFFKGLL